MRFLFLQPYSTHTQKKKKSKGKTIFYINFDKFLSCVDFGLQKGGLEAQERPAECKQQ